MEVIRRDGVVYRNRGAYQINGFRMRALLMRHDAKHMKTLAMPRVHGQDVQVHRLGLGKTPRHMKLDGIIEPLLGGRICFCHWAEAFVIRWRG